MSDCPCGSGKALASCCGPYLNGELEAPTAEALMRSRYTAYTQGNIAYIKSTTDKTTREKFDAENAQKWADDSRWDGLEILSMEAGTEMDDTGKVEFIARYSQNNETYEHHEHAEFKRTDGRWFFVDGKIVNTSTFVRETPKVGRNDPCTCGSGKKFKKCCGKAG